MKFSYVCPERHETEHEFPAGAAPRQTLCLQMVPSLYHDPRPCPNTARRNFGIDFASASISTGDPYRAYHLSCAKSAAAQKQQRNIGGPQDNFERKRIERERGIMFVGNDTDGMSAPARRAIEKAKEKC